MSDETMFDHLQSAEAQTAQTLKEYEEKETPTASPTETKPDQFVSEDVKTPEKTEKAIPYSRFKDTIEERNTWKNRAEELAPLRSEVDQLKTQIAELTGQHKSDLPKFETVEELTAYIAQLPAKIKEELRAEQMAELQQQSSLEQEATRQVQEQLGQLREMGVELNTKAERDALLEFAIKYQLDNLITAHELYEQVQTTAEQAKKKGEEIGRRKADSGIKSTIKAPDSKVIFQGRTLDDIFEEAKRNLPA